MFQCPGFHLWIPSGSREACIQQLMPPRGAVKLTSKHPFSGAKAVSFRGQITTPKDGDFFREIPSGRGTIPGSWGGISIPLGSLQMSGRIPEEAGLLQESTLDPVVHTPQGTIHVNGRFWNPMIHHTLVNENWRHVVTKTSYLSNLGRFTFRLWIFYSMKCLLSVYAYPQ